MDPRFGSDLRRLRMERGLSLRDLAKRVHHGKSYIHALETGRARPNREVAARLDTALNTGEVLAALVHDARSYLPPEQRERLAVVAAQPRRVDRATVDALAGVLSHCRRLEDTLGAFAVLASVSAHLATVDALLKEARGPVRLPLVDVAAQWSQYAGWLAIATEQPERAAMLLDRAVALATEAQSPDLVATAISFKGHAAYRAGQPGPVVTLSEAARRDPRVYVGQRAYDALQAARGYAMTGDTREALRLLSIAADEDAATAEHTGHVPDWHYYRTPGFYLLERGLAYTHLGAVDGRKWNALAVDSIRTGLAMLPPDMREAEWTDEYRLALATAHLRDGDRRSAADAVAEVQVITAGRRRLPRELAELSSHPSVDG